MRAIEVAVVCLISSMVSTSAIANSGGGEAAKAAPAREEVQVPPDPVDESLIEKPSKLGSRDVKLPKKLVEDIEHEYREYLKHEGISGGVKRVLVNIKVELRQTRVAALHEPTRVVTPLGGGVIDLADFVTPLRGAFQMKIRAHMTGQGDPRDWRVFFVSRAPRRKLAGEDYGAGCDKYMEITAKFRHAMNGSGFDLFTADRRYLSVIGGTFLIVGFRPQALQVGSVTFVDSRYPNLLCGS